jgi:hypothetical protein
MTKKASETLNVQSNETGQATLTYERTSDKELLTLEISAIDGRARIRRMPRGSATFPAVEYRQSPREPVSLTIGTGRPQREFHGAGIWQLMIRQPAEGREHLAPLLETLQPDWQISERVAAIEMRLLQDANDATKAGRAKIAELVALLADESFAKREAADRKLREGNASTLAYLRQLDFHSLEAEQQLRIDRIVTLLSEQNGEDTAELAAASLAGDPMVWLALLARPETATRKAAARQLASLLGEPIEVDPAADPVSQQAKWEQLRMRIEGN